MADIFISYASEDRNRVIPVVKALERYGWSVWWDRIIPPGKTFAKVIEEALGASRCLIVLWTAASVKSDWVSNEAAEGARRGLLIPALLDDVEIPFEFKRIQAANLTDWRERSGHDGFKQLLSAVTDLIGPPEEAPQALPASPADTSAATNPETAPATPVKPLRPEPGLQQPQSDPAGRRPAARIIGGIALAVIIAGGALMAFRSGFFHPNKIPPEFHAPKPVAEIAAQPARPEPPVAPPEPERQPDTEAPATVPKPGTAPPAPAADPPAKQPSGASMPDAPAAETKPPILPPMPEQRTPPSPIIKAPPPEKPLPEPKTPPPQVKPDRQKPPQPAAKSPAPAAAPPESYAAAPPAKLEDPAPAVKPKESLSRKTITNSIGMEFVLIPAASAGFTMGSRLGIGELVQRFGGNEAAYKNEKPFRPVRIEKPFYLLTTPVTQGQWRRVLGDNPSSFRNCGDACPVEMVSWGDAQRFIARLNEMEGSASYRLPSEAEWEYAARSGSESEFFFGDEAGRLVEFAWYSANSNNQTHPVAQKKPNAWGLYDMHGNVWEWMQDDWQPSYDGAPANGSARIDPKQGSAKVVRGGAWSVVARYCRSAARYYGNPDSRTSHVGFRLVKSAGG